MSRTLSGRGLTLALLSLSVVADASSAQAGGWLFGRRRTVAPTVSTRPAASPPSPMLGSFYPNPYMIVRGNGTTGGGYTPGSGYGENTLALYGPLSPLRAKAAPVLTYSRGYDGLVRPTLGTSFSTPFLPEITPVVYPTRANVAGAFRYTNTPPWWPNGTNFIDQN
jgi:hypothetical protein